MIDKAQEQRLKMIARDYSPKLTVTIHKDRAVGWVSCSQTRLHIGNFAMLEAYLLGMHDAEVVKQA